MTATTENLTSATNTMRRTWLSAARCAVGTVALTLAGMQPWTLVMAQTFPQRPIRLVSPIPPGGAPDMIARALGAKLSTQMAQAVVIDNKIGSNGQAAAEFVARAPADGHTLLVGMDSLFAINPYLYARTAVDVNKDLIPVATLGANQFVLALNPQLPVQNLAEFIALAKKSNPPLAYASGGNGSQHHLTMEMLKARAGFDMLHVPYKGGTPATTATIGGETAAMFSGTSNATLIKAGKLRAVATTGKQRSKALPDVPTLGESFPGFENTIWIGLFAPAGTPPSVVQKLRDEVDKALNAPDLIDGFQKAGGIETLHTSLEEMQQMIKRDQSRYSKIIRELQLKVD
ncbi:MAG: tripartite tricarboxylate transporter substrate binding protein [Betaproteobacteria bacterium]|jgi:tripartite-type tricarboxylate transporter receptor subunit TctC|nr:tripartite tricarboxylate transporter substrate binding protein [Betaproteobacteria bacterium]